MATRTGSAEWRGDLKGGAGSVSVGDGVFQGVYSFSSRFEEGDGTNPEESSPPLTRPAWRWHLATSSPSTATRPSRCARPPARTCETSTALPLSRGSTSTSRRESPTSTRGTSASMPRRPRLAVRSRARSRACPRSAERPTRLRSVTATFGLDQAERAKARRCAERLDTPVPAAALIDEEHAATATGRSWRRDRP